MKDYFEIGIGFLSGLAITHLWGKFYYWWKHKDDAKLKSFMPRYINPKRPL